MAEAVIVSAVRTAIGNYGGTLRDTPAVKLGSIVIKEALRRVGLRPQRGKDARSPGGAFCTNTTLVQVEKWVEK